MTDKEKEAYEKGVHDGFVQGQAWAIAVQYRYEMLPDELLLNSGIERADLYKHKVDAYDRSPILKQWRRDKKYA